jgi:hypothetical protein
VVVFESLALNGALVLDASQLPHDAKVLSCPHCPSPKDALQETWAFTLFFCFFLWLIL